MSYPPNPMNPRAVDLKQQDINKMLRDAKTHIQDPLPLDEDRLRKEPLTRKIYWRDNPKNKHVTAPLKKDIDVLSMSEPLTPENIEKMKNNIFVNLRSQFPNASRRELREETRRRLNQEIKRRKKS